MSRVVVEGMPETAVGGGVMLSRRGSKARRRKRKELFAIQMCFAGVLLGFVVGLQSVAQRAGEEQLSSHVCGGDSGDVEFVASRNKTSSEGKAAVRRTVMSRDRCFSFALD